MIKPSESLELVKRLKSIADTGLVFAENEYDRERYEELRSISLQLLQGLSDTPLAVLSNFFLPVTDYPTVKVDVRGFVLNEQNEILMAQESVDGKWTIPGGWADIGYTPTEVALKEIEEETGLHCKVNRLLAIYDKRCHSHPPQPFYIYKLIFHCKVVSGSLKPGFDMKDAGFFSIDALPELSEDRIVRSQLEQLYTLATTDIVKVHFD